MSTSFRLLFSPQRLRNCEIRNRILSTGHQTYLAKGNMPQDDFIAYHEARARGGGAMEARSGGAVTVYTTSAATSMGPAGRHDLATERIMSRSPRAITISR